MIRFKTVYFCCDYLQLLVDCYHSWTCIKAGTDFDLPLWLFRSICFAVDDVCVVFEDNFFNLKGHKAQFLGQVERGDE